MKVAVQSQAGTFAKKQTSPSPIVVGGSGEAVDLTVEAFEALKLEA